MIQREDGKRKKLWGISLGRCLRAAEALFFYIGVMQWLKHTFQADVEAFRELHYINIVLILGFLVNVQIPEKWRRHFARLFFCFTPAFCVWQIEVLHGNVVSEMEFLFVFLNYVIILAVLLLIHVVINRFPVTIMLGTVIFIFYGLLYSFVSEFRGNGLRAADIYAAQTAANVAEGYSLHFTDVRTEAVLLAAGWILLAHHIGSVHLKADRIKTAVAAVGIWWILGVMFLNDKFMEEHSVKPYVWELADSEKDHGALLDFAAGLPYLKTEKPQGYTRKKVDEIEKQQAHGDGLQVQLQEEIKRPHIIAIMNESFADFRKLGQIEMDQDILKYWDRYQKNTIKGYVSVPVFGGWTANSEFEFLTGFSDAFFPSGVIPFQNYVREGTPSLNSQLKEQGYTSVFLHPMEASGWNREKVYDMLGFDEAYFLEDMEEPGTLRNVVSDKWDYGELIRKYEEQKENGPVFLFNVTIQNHGGYAWGGLDNPVQIKNPAGEFSQAEEYLTLIRESDKALKRLLDYFSKEEEPVLVCVFGDHYPKVEEELYAALSETVQGSEAEKTALKYQTPFMIYTNYDIEEKQYENISLNYLSTLLCSAAGIPLTDYQAYLEGLFETYPVVNVYGVKDKEGVWYNWDEALEFSEIKEYEMVQYRNLFDMDK